MTKFRLVRTLALLWLFGTLCTPAQAAATPWEEIVRNFEALFDKHRFVEPMRPHLTFFRDAFMCLGMGAVMIASIRRVARARNGEESMGWVAGMVMTVSLMACGPRIGREVFDLGDELAAVTRYSGSDTIKTCWNSMLILLPNGSPAQEQLPEDREAGDLGPEPAKRTPLRIVIWRVVTAAYRNVEGAFSHITGLLSAAINRVFVFVVVLIPAIAILLGALVTGFAGLFREILREGFDLFLPMMIGMLCFAPLRGPASQFLTRYVAVAFWPVAWALSNAVSVSLLICCMQWVVRVSIAILTRAQVLPDIAGHPETLQVSPGLFAAAASLMSWTALVPLCLAATFVALLLLVGTFVAPALLTRAVTRGSCFVQEQVQQAIAVLNTPSPSGAPAGNVMADRTGSASTTGRAAVAAFASRASSTLSRISQSLRASGGTGGATAVLASTASTLIGRAASGTQAWSVFAEERGGMSGNTEREPRKYSLASVARHGASSTSPSGTSPRAHRRGSI